MLVQFSKKIFVLGLLTLTLACAKHQARDLIESEYNGQELQIKLWMAQESGQTAEAEKLRDLIETTLVSGECVLEKAALGGNATRPNLLTCDHGIGAVYKKKKMLSPLQEPTAAEGDSILANASAAASGGDSAMEVAAYRADALFQTNVIPVTVIRFDPERGVGSAQYFVHGGQRGGNTEDSHGFRRMKILDYIIRNVDRHGDNFLYLPEHDRIVAIDHGWSFNDERKVAHPIISLATLVEYLAKEPDLKKRIRTITAKEIRSEMSRYLKTQQLESMIHRVHAIQNAVKE